jgi:hypothetical protein
MKLSTLIATATTAAVLGTAGISIAGATTSDTSSPTPTSAPAASDAQQPAGHDGASAWRRHHRRRHARRAAFRLAAKTIGITPEQLWQEVRSGKTIAEVATDHGVQPQTVIDAIVTAANKKIDAAHDAGKLTDAQVARLKARVANVVPRFVNEWHPKHAADQTS